MRVLETTASEWACNIIHSGSNPYGLSIQTDGNASTTYSFACYTQTAQDFYIRNDGIFSMGCTPYTTSHVLNLDGTGLALKNDTNGSNNNWSSIRNLDSGSGSNFVFTTGGGTALTLDHDMGANFGQDVTAVGDVVAYSDKKLKKNIKTLDGSKVYDMRGVSFTRLDFPG